MNRWQVRRASWVAAVAVLGVAVLAFFSGSGLRPYLPSLHDTYQAAAPKRPTERFRSAVASSTAGNSAGPPPAAQTAVHARPELPTLPRPTWRAPLPRALPTPSLERLLWKACGGHGRLGPGARI